MSLHLRKLDTHQLPLLRKWLLKPDIAAVFGEPSEWLEEIELNLKQSDWVKYFLLYAPGPSGFCQYYCTRKAPPGIWSDELPGTVGIDYLIADPANRHKGRGSEMLDLLLLEIRKNTAIKFVISDPAASNIASIKLLEKFGFQESHNKLYRLVL